MLAPGDPRDPIQIIDVRDLAAFTLRLIEDDVGGVFNVLSPPGRFSIGNLVEAGLAKRQTASEYLKELAAIGVLEERAEGREKLYLNTRFWKLLTQEPNEFEPFPNTAT